MMVWYKALDYTTVHNAFMLFNFQHGTIEL